MKVGTSRSRRWGKLAVIAAGALLLSGCTPSADAIAQWPAQASGPLPAAVQTQLDSSVDAAMKLAGASGAIVGVWAPWSGSWTAGLGTTTLKGTTPVTTNMEFRIGQNTTSMTCTVLLGMVDDGTVRLDDPVHKYLPQMTGIGDITLRQLCQNTSGLGSYTSDLTPQFVNNPKREWVPLELVTDGMGAAGTMSPGSGFTDSDAGMVLLGLALETASGQSWDSLYQHYIFDRLGLQNTSFPSPTSTTIPGAHPDGYATALNDLGAPVCGTVLDETELSPSMAWTAGGAISSLGDLKTYLQALTSGSLVTASSHKAQWTTILPGTGAPTWSGYGLGVSTLGPMRGQVGDIPGYITAMMSDPASGLTVIVMLNNSSAGGSFAQELAMELASIVSKAPARNGSAAVAALPWTQEQTAANLKTLAVCQPAAAASAAAK